MRTLITEDDGDTRPIWPRTDRSHDFVPNRVGKTCIRPGCG